MLVMLYLSFCLLGDRNGGKTTLIKALLLESKHIVHYQLENNYIYVSNYDDENLLYDLEVCDYFLNKPKTVKCDFDEVSLGEKYVFTREITSLLKYKYQFVMYVIDITAEYSKKDKIRDLKMLNNYHKNVLFIFNKSSSFDINREIIFTNKREQKKYETINQLIRTHCNEISYQIICADLLGIYKMRLIMFKPKLHDMSPIKLIEHNTLSELEYESFMNELGYVSLKKAMDIIYNKSIQYYFYQCDLSINWLDADNNDYKNILDTVKKMCLLQKSYDTKKINNKQALDTKIKDLIKQSNIVEKYNQCDTPTKVIEFVKSICLFDLENIIIIANTYKLMVNDNTQQSKKQFNIFLPELATLREIMLLRRLFNMNCLTYSSLPSKLLKRYSNRSNNKVTITDVLLSYSPDFYFTHEHVIKSILTDQNKDLASDLCMKIIKIKLNSKCEQKKIYLINILTFTKSINSKYYPYFESFSRSSIKFDLNDIDMINSHKNMELYIFMEKEFLL